MSKHPYTDLPSHSFWKTAVAELEPRSINIHWYPKFKYAKTDKIITAGSCFAQHISRSLREHGFTWIDAEPAPAGMPISEHAGNGYGIFSFRTGNIYTAGLLKQWIFWALGKVPQSNEVFQEGSRFYDPFRPTITEAGFDSADALLESRAHSLKRIQQAVSSADLFIFTLGLTEAWLNSDGTIYAMCPGTAHGTFSPEQHRFHNFSEPEIERDLTETFDALRAINPTIRFLLTVSPVPLTATASGQHVITATTHSKSVLRSVAGRLADARDDTDYFPSYELITSPAFKGMWFEKNMRTVLAEGVAFVMNQFMSAVKGLREVAVELPLSEPVVVKPNEKGDLCDEIILESWANRKEYPILDTPNILLLGDSHMGKIAHVFDERNIRYVGGAVMQASSWLLGAFELLSSAAQFKLLEEKMQARWSVEINSFIESKPTSGASPIIFTNVGAHSAIWLVTGEFDNYLRTIYGDNLSRVSYQVIRGFLLKDRIKHLMLIRKLVDANFKVIWISDPPLEDEAHKIFDAFDAILCEMFKETGCCVFSARDWIKNRGKLPDEYKSTEIDRVTQKPDWIHGSNKYYKDLIVQVCQTYGISLG